MKLFLYLAACLTFHTIAFAQESSGGNDVLCINDKDGRKGASNQIINKMIDQANDPLAQAFASYQKAACEEAINSGPENSLRKFLKVANLYKDINNAVSDVEPTFIKKQCVEAALQRDIAQKAYACDRKRTSFANSGKNETPCLNQKSVDYIHYAVNLAIKCFATVAEPIDPRFLLKKINNETGFNFFLASEGGTGLGQLTSYPVRDLAGQKAKEGNGRFVLEDLAASKDSACEPFKKVIQKDLKNPPPVPPIDNVCSYVSVNDGLARTLVIGMGYYIYNRDQVVIPYLEANMGAQAVKNKELVNYATLLTYGPDGPNGAKAYLDRKGFKKNKRLSPSTGIEKIKSAGYVKATDRAYEEDLLGFLKPDNKKPSKQEVRGDTCVGR